MINSSGSLIKWVVYVSVIRAIVNTGNIYWEHWCVKLYTDEVWMHDNNNNNNVMPKCVRVTPKQLIKPRPLKK